MTRQFRDSPGARPSANSSWHRRSRARPFVPLDLWNARISVTRDCRRALSCVAAVAFRWSCRACRATPPTARSFWEPRICFYRCPGVFLLLMVRACLPLNVSPMVSLTITFLLLGALGWAAPARVVRRRRCESSAGSDFMLHARATGCPPWRLLWRHLLLNAMPILFAQLWITIPAYVLAESTLGMLGLGVMEPLPSWGNLLREHGGRRNRRSSLASGSRDYCSPQWWEAFKRFLSWGLFRMKRVLFTLATALLANRWRAPFRAAPRAENDRTLCCRPINPRKPFVI